MTFAIFHDFPGLENGLSNSMTFHDQGAPCTWSCWQTNARLHTPSMAEVTKQPICN